MIALALALQAGLSLVIATTERQDDPRPISCRGCGDSHFRARFDGGKSIAGEPLPPSFDARLRLHTPLITKTTLALILRREADGSLLVLRRAGFNGRNGFACFSEPDEEEVNWRPEAPGTRVQRGILCVFDALQIDPNAPRNRRRGKAVIPRTGRRMPAFHP